ncbi:MAG: VirB4 family type IV secretion system protein, partial [Pseudonocardia sp.]
PGLIEMAPRHLVIDGEHVATLVVTGHPREVGPGWLDPLLGWPGRLDVSVHIAPVDPATAADRLRRRLARLESGRRHAEDHGRIPDADVDAAVEDAHELAARVARAEAKLFRVGLVLAVYAATDTRLAEDVAAVRALAGSLLLDAQPASYRQVSGWTSCLPLGIDALQSARTMDTEAIAAAFPFTSPDLPTDPITPGLDGVLYGFNLGSSGLVAVDRFGGDNYNSVILGRSGAGKSYLVKLELIRSLYQGITAHVIDPEDEYSRLAHAVGATVIHLGQPGTHINPFDLPTGVADPVTRAALFVHTTIGVLLGEPTPAHRAILDHAISITYQRAGIQARDPATWQHQPPLLANLVHTLREHTDDPDAGLLADRLHPFTEGAFAGLLSGHTTTSGASTDPAGDHLAGDHLVVFSLRGLPDELRPLGTLLTLNTIWQQVSDPAQRRPRLVVVDEAWLLMQQPAGARFLARLAKAGRKHWCGLTVCTQDAVDVLASDLGKAVVANAATQILLRQSTQAIDEVTRVFD